MAANIPTNVPSGNAAFIGIPDSEDIPRLVYCAPYFTQVPLAELIEPSVVEAVNNVLPSLVPPYVDAAAQAAVQNLAVLLTGSTMTGPLFLSPLMPTQPSQAATMAYVDSMIATAGIPEVPPVPSGQVWARETGQWVPITPQTGVFLPLAGGSMQGNINMSGNTIQNMAAVPAMPNGAAPAQWVLNQIASVSLYQGTWDADTNVPDLTQLSTHVNGYTWIALTTAPGGVVIGPAIPGLQGQTVFNGDTIIYSTVQGAFKSIHGGGITLPEADARFVQLAGSQMSGALLLNANASQPMQAVTFQQMEAFVPPGVVPEAPNDGQLYGRNGLTASWTPVLPLAGGILTGALTLAGNATANFNPVPLQQMTSAISAATAPLLPLAGGAMTGPMTLSGNATVNLNPVPLQQINAMLGSYLPLSGGTLTGDLHAPNLYGNNVIATAALWQGTATPTANSIAAQNLVCFGTTTLEQTGISNGLTVQSGQLVVNATGNAIAAPNGNITVNSGQAGLSAADTAGFSVFGFANFYRFINVGTNPVWHWQGNGPSFTDHMMLFTSGNLTISGTLSQGSDVNLKHNIQGWDGGLDVIAQLNPKTFQFIEDETDHVHLGFVAQDLEECLPHAVKEGCNSLLALDTTAILAACVGAIKQLQARIAVLEAH